MIVKIKKLIHITLFMLILNFNIYSKYLINITMQKCWENKFIISCGYNKYLNNRNYLEFGFNILPAKTHKLIEKQEFLYEKQELNSLYGVYSGYYIVLAPIIRPGIVIGTNFIRKLVYRGLTINNLNKSSYTNYKISPYFGFTTQLGIFTFIVTNIGVGGGINFNF